MTFITLITVTFDAVDQDDAEHLATIMRSRLDDLTPESTHVAGKVVKPIERSQCS